MSDFTLLHGDVIEKLKELPDESVDAIVQDPPYNLNFMGKKWDSKGGPYAFQKWCEDWATECLRVLRPGGHLLCFGGTRTYHRMTTGIEDAGFQIRDCITWLYGTGFPKSLNVGKAMDKHLGNERKIVGKNPNHRESDALYHLGFQGGKGDGQITKGEGVWEGYGTALKPASEPIVVAQKPKEGTYVNNAIKHGVGPLNIDACRVPTNPEVDDMKRIVHRNERNPDSDWAQNSGFKNETNNYTGVPSEGRFPANVVHDGSAIIIEAFPDSKGAGGSTPQAKTTGYGRNLNETGTYTYFGGERTPFESGKGSAARFFYCAKASKGERNAGLEDFPQITAAERTGRKENSAGLHTTARPNVEGGNPYAGSSSGKMSNHHPTVKPIRLMEWLLNLVCPTKDAMGRQPVVLDCFVGSGTTGIAAQRLNLDFIGIDTNAEYLQIAKARIEHDKRESEKNTL